MLSLRQLRPIGVSFLTLAVAENPCKYWAFTKLAHLIQESFSPSLKIPPSQLTRPPRPLLQPYAVTYRDKNKCIRTLALYDDSISNARANALSMIGTGELDHIISVRVDNYDYDWGEDPEPPSDLQAVLDRR